MSVTLQSTNRSQQSTTYNLKRKNKVTHSHVGDHNNDHRATAAFPSFSFPVPPGLLPAPLLPRVVSSCVAVAPHFLLHLAAAVSVHRLPSAKFFHAMRNTCAPLHQKNIHRPPFCAIHVPQN